MTEKVNDYLVMISGISGSGKSAALMGLAEGKNPEGVMYLNTEAGKKLPFPNKFTSMTVTDPYQVFGAFDEAEEAGDDCHTIVIDSQTFLMDMFESQYVLGTADTMKGWSDYQQYFKKLMQEYVANSTKNVIFTAHVMDTYNESAMCMESKIPVKGALKSNGIEAFFSMVIGTVKMTLKDLKPYSSKYLNVTEDDLAVGYKHVFQVRPTKQTVNSRLRTPLKMFSIKETFIDNNVEFVLERAREYYGD